MRVPCYLALSNVLTHRGLTTWRDTCVELDLCHGKGCSKPLFFSLAWSFAFEEIRIYIIYIHHPQKYIYFINIAPDDKY